MLRARENLKHFDVVYKTNAGKKERKKYNNNKADVVFDKYCKIVKHE
jgi:hypothetical protein